MCVWEVFLFINLGDAGRGVFVCSIMKLKEDSVITFPE